MQKPFTQSEGGSKIREGKGDAKFMPNLRPSAPRRPQKLDPLTPQPPGGEVCLLRWALVGRLRPRSQHWRTPHRCRPDRRPWACNWSRQSHQAARPAQALLRKSTRSTATMAMAAALPAARHPDKRGLIPESPDGPGPLGNPSAPSPGQNPRGLAPGGLDSVHASERQAVRMWYGPHKMQWSRQQCSAANGRWVERIKIEWVTGQLMLVTTSWMTRMFRQVLWHWLS